MLNRPLKQTDLYHLNLLVGEGNKSVLQKITCLPEPPPSRNQSRGEKCGKVLTSVENRRMTDQKEKMKLQKQQENEGEKKKRQQKKEEKFEEKARKEREKAEKARKRGKNWFIRLSLLFKYYSNGSCAGKGHASQGGSDEDTDVGES